MANQSDIIEIKNLIKSYKGSGEYALKGINLKINAHEVFGILGPNGAGKTTLIKLLCGLFPPSSGYISIAGFDIVNDISEIRKIIGVVPQDIALYSSLTAKENLVFFGKIYGLPFKELNHRIGKYLNIFGLEKSAGKKISSFSGGMKRRINLICGILHDPEILFLDEPTVGVDVQSKTLILENLLELHDHGTTIIYTSHLMQEAENLCTDIAIIDEGKVITQGSPIDLISINHVTTLEDVYLKLTGKALRD